MALPDEPNHFTPINRTPDMNKKEITALQKKITRKLPLAWDVMSSVEFNDAFSLAEEYKRFLDTAKTEREAAGEILRQAIANGFVSLDDALSGKAPAGTTRVYSMDRNKSIILAVLGNEPLSSGAALIASHIDSPRLDLKQNPVYEDTNLALLKTHYYGGIRKYQWLSVPLSLHGRVVRADGETLDLVIGETPGDPVFVITDLLPHLAGKVQEDKKLSEAFDGEKLNLVAGSIPLGAKETSERIKLGLLKHLYDAYGIMEEDFTSAEFEAVPAARAMDIGFDRSLIGGYGQDDRICAFTQMRALFDVKRPPRTAIAAFFDKEEIGSEGNTGAQSIFLKDVISDLLFLESGEASERVLRKAMHRTWALSADVNAAMDPDYKDVHESMNAARLGQGICMTKFTGVRGKSGSSDAGAEFIGSVRRIFNRNKVVWQTGELGRIDHGGGGTIAKFMAQHGMEILDCGPALLSMHSPCEISSKADLYMTWKGYTSFFNHER